MGRYKKYTSDKQLREAVEDYFKSISRMEVVKELVNTGQKDSWGHFILEYRPVMITRDGVSAPIMERIFHVPPTRGDLCNYLGISRMTWANYCDPEQNPKFAETTEWAEDQLRNWRDKELLKRSGKNIKGLIHDMAINYGASEKQMVLEKAGYREKTASTASVEIPLSERQELLAEIARDFANGGGPSGAATE